ncbi:MAG: polyribonucleotide nucleotidyltransferase [Candidatus Marinimicrobia bacterium]|nr:polyribonucleotide nucleotidyltransferase [Candidatus Neomarinimicrobiota bacterium]|tara:strand:+ start:976 stop:3150 length:2175 start_codon:yes stop_codon:yes gene_type:complete
MIKKEIQYSGRNLSLEVGRIARQANGSVVVTQGETVVFVAVCATKGDAEDKGFFPLSVDYREKMYASGKIPGGFFKREARPSEMEILAARLTDRPLRPLFPKGFFNETQVMINVLSYDGENSPDVLGTIGASAALAISDIPWNGPVASVHVGRIEGEIITSPTKTQMEESDYDIIVSGTEESIVMVEGEADFISEGELLEAIKVGHETIKDLIKLQKELVVEVGSEKREVTEIKENEELIGKVKALIDGKVSPLNDPKVKFQRYHDISEFKTSIIDQLKDEYPDDIGKIKTLIDDAITSDLRERTLNGTRADGRDTKTVRDISISTEILPRTHGSCLFTRGETQALAVATLGGKRDEQMLDNLDGLNYKPFMLHYNFPPYCVGEVRRMFSTSRREVGHGNLAERAVKKSLPSDEEFPYTIRVVSEVMESNGSSSMATVCASTLSLLDAGVPLKEPIAGVAMGLVMEDNQNYAILTDILGTEDHLGDMDFKVAGSKNGITAIQMDLKIDGLPYDLLKEALAQAKEARFHILDLMNDCLEKERPQLSQYAPKIMMSTLPVDIIGQFIGPSGKNIKQLCADYECEIDIAEDGKTNIFGTNQEKLDQVKAIVDSYSIKPVVGEIYSGKVDRIMDFGAFIDITPTISGLVHISALDWKRVEKVEDVIKVGDVVDVKLMEIDNMGRYNLSIKHLKEKPEGYEERPPRKDNKGGGGRTGDRHHSRKNQRKR